MGKAAQRKGEFRKKRSASRIPKIDPEKLKAYVAEHPDTYQSEMAQVFGCSESGIRDTLRRHKITRKKRQPGIRTSKK